jgi:hypothetical protein
LRKKRVISLILIGVIVSTVLVVLFLRTPFLGALETLFFPYDSSKNPVNIDFKYGLYGRNELDTFKGIFTKDLVADGTITTRLTLTQEELIEIRDKLVGIGFFDYPGTFPSQGIVTPRADFYLKVQNGSTLKEVTWYSDSQFDSKTESDLTELYYIITGIVEEKLEYKLLPPPNGAYA